MPELCSAEAEQALGLKHKYHIGADSTAPLGLLVHGRAGNFDLMWAFRRTLPESFNIITPQAPEPDALGGFSWWPVDLPREDFKARAEKAAEGIERFLSVGLSYYNLSPRLIVAYGFSQGAGLLSVVLQRSPNLFTAVALLAGFVIKQGDTPLSEGPRVFIGHGSRDGVVPLDKALEGKRHLEARGLNVELVQDDVEHKVGTQAMRRLSEWVRIGV